MSTHSGGDPAVVGELAKFANMITDPHARREFDRDPRGTLAKHDVDVDSLPQSVRDFITNLSFEELRMLAQMQQTMVAENLSVPTAYGAVGHL